MNERDEWREREREREWGKSVWAAWLDDEVDDTDDDDLFLVLTVRMVAVVHVLLMSDQN